MAKWQDVIAQLHESIKREEENNEFAYVDDWIKTPAMRRWEKRFNERIDVGIRTEPLVCNWFPRLCTRINSARCFYHRYGQIDARLALGWRRILGMAKTNPKVDRLLGYMREKKRDMEKVNRKQVPAILTYNEVLIIIQALALVPVDLEIEG